MEAEIRALIEKDKIRDALYRYCRGVDRCDRDLLKSVYHPDGRDEHGVFSGLGWDFVEFVMPFLEQMGPTTHSISNCLIELDGDVANVESYCVAFHTDVSNEAGELTDLVVGARYVDRFEKREGEWRVAHRQCVFDWNQNPLVTGKWAGPMHGQYKPRGGRGKQDYSYSLSEFYGKLA